MRVVGRLWYFGRVEVTSSAWVDPPGLWVSAISDETSEMPGLDEFLDLILKSLTLVG